MVSIVNLPPFSYPQDRKSRILMKSRIHKFRIISHNLLYAKCYEYKMNNVISVINHLQFSKRNKQVIIIMYGKYCIN